MKSKRIVVYLLGFIFGGLSTLSIITADKLGYVIVGVIIMAVVYFIGVVIFVEQDEF